MNISEISQDEVDFEAVFGSVIAEVPDTMSCLHPADTVEYVRVFGETQAQPYMKIKGGKQLGQALVELCKKENYDLAEFLLRQKLDWCYHKEGSRDHIHVEIDLEDFERDVCRTFRATGCFEKRHLIQFLYWANS